MGSAVRAWWAWALCDLRSNAILRACGQLYGALKCHGQYNRRGSRAVFPACAKIMTINPSTVTMMISIIGLLIVVAGLVWKASRILAKIEARVEELSEDLKEHLKDHSREPARAGYRR